MESNSRKSFWNLKPYWCQPWTIITFGILMIILSWTFFSNIIITSVVGFFIFAWWALFLILAPSSYQDLHEKQ